MAHDDSVLIESGLQVLKRYASQGETLSYDDLHRELGRPYKGADIPGQVGKLCDDITVQHSNATGLHLMISVLVREEGTGLPGDGFFKLAADLGRLPFTDDVDVKRAFVEQQEQRVFMVCRPSTGATPFR